MFRQLFDGNNDRNTIVYQTLSQPIRARYIRILPEAWYAAIAMRMELYGCSGIFLFPYFRIFQLATFTPQWNPKSYTIINQNCSGPREVFSGVP